MSDLSGHDHVGYKDALSNLQGAEHAARITRVNSKTDAVVRNGDGSYDELEAHANAMEREADAMEREADAMRIGNGHLMDRLIVIQSHLAQANRILTEQLDTNPSGRDWGEVFSARIKVRDAHLLASPACDPVLISNSECAPKSPAL